MGSTDPLDGKYPAKAHARKVTEYLKNAGHDMSKAIIYLEGQKTRNKEDNDETAPFRFRCRFRVLVLYLIYLCQATTIFLLHFRR